MIKKLPLLLFILIVVLKLEGTPPVSYAFMIADLKHSEEEGIKICELQLGTFSAFRGYDWLIDEPGAVPKKIISMFKQFGHSVWVHPGTFQELAIRNEMASQKINSTKNLKTLYNNKKFIQEAGRAVEDPNDLASYPVLLIANPHFFKDKLETFQIDFPNVLILDLPCFPYWRDKYQMSLLFKEDPVLEQIKPHWKLFERAMPIQDIEESHTHFASNYVVIKPLSSLLGKGVILVERMKLPEALKLICQSPAQPTENPDEEYNYWRKAKDKHLIVEECYFSDPVTVPHLNNKEYDPTLRIAFMIWHEHGEIQMDFVELHWKLPHTALSEEGSFKDKHKSYDYIPHFAAVDPDREEAIKRQLRETMPLIYARILKGDSLLQP